MTYAALKHAITEDQILEYESYGVVCVRDQFDQAWVDKMMDAALGHMTAHEFTKITLKPLHFSWC